MKKEELKGKLFAQLAPAVFAKFNPHIMAVIDENVESVLDGSTNINGKKAETEEEILQACFHGLVARLGVYMGLLETAKRLVNPDSIITINYRNESLTFRG